MCKRNCPHKNEASTRYVRETPQIKKKKNKKRSQLGMCKRNSPREKSNKQGMCKRNSPQKNKASAGCVRETPRIKMKPAQDA